MHAHLLVFVFAIVDLLCEFHFGVAIARARQYIYM